MLNKSVLLPFLLVVVIYTHCISGLSPILIVPGYTGSQLEAKISSNDDDPSNCNTGGKWLVYWANFNVPVKCINEVLQLQYNTDAGGTYMNSSGVEVRVPGFGNTETVEFLDDEDRQKTPYFHTFVEHFVAKGYERGKSIRAAPYDWRLAADELKKIGYYELVKGLIETMYKDNSNKVSIVVHSMGGPVTLYFLNNIVSQDWKDKYINTFIPLSGAWSGGNGVLLTYISAIRSPPQEALGVSFQSMESTVWLMPSPFIWKDKVIITTDTVTYSANDYEKMFDSLDRKTDYTKLKNSISINGDYPAPNVSVNCFYGVGVDTIEVVNYGDSLPKAPKNVTYGDGDGSVNLLSSEVCLKWSKEMTAPFKFKRFHKISHGEMITSQLVLDAIDEAMEIPSLN